MNCSLCGATPNKAVVYSGRRQLLKCDHCRLIFARAEDRLPADLLRQRYLLHENSPSHEGYCRFLYQAIHLAKPHLRPGSKGLDFGCGPGPTLSALVQAEGFQMTDYDPIFFDRPLHPPYDFIFSTECFEHFEEPTRDIARVVGLLAKAGVLTLMTELWDDSKDFQRWPYALDPTHVSFYAKETLDYICSGFGLRLVDTNNKRVFVLKKQSQE